jgi:hypothetical protein
VSTTQPPVPRSEKSNWATFVAVYLIIAGTLNVIWGISALNNKAYFTSEGLLWSSLNTWGWVAIILGAVIAGFLAFCGIMLNFLSIGAYPVWSVILLVIDALIIWAVTVHGEEFV